LDNCDTAAKSSKDNAVRRYGWLKKPAIRTFKDDLGSKSVAASSQMFKQHVRIALGYCTGFNPDAWEAIPVLGHFGWALIKDALPFLVDEDKSNT
jgi:hypothetical protein